MSNESKDIRLLMEDIKNIINKSSLNESYVFGEKPTQTPGGNLNPVKEEPNLDNKPELVNKEIEQGLDSTKQIEDSSKSTIDNDIVKIRQMALNLLANINPLKDPEQSKVVKTIWDACDKFLTKDAVTNKPKPEENNNNNI